MEESAAIIADVILLILLVITSISIACFRNLIINVVVMCIFSFIMALLYLVMDAPDVAITEASVGAGVSTVFMLSALSLIKNRKARRNKVHVLPFLISIITFLSLLYIITDLPEFGNPGSPINNHVAPYYLINTYEKMGIPNLVTSILASFRGYDTFCETVVVFSAALGVSLLLGKEEGDDKK